jgi:hypothetical protein
MAFAIDTSDATKRILRVADWPDLVLPSIRHAVRESSAELKGDVAASISRQQPPRSSAYQPPARDTGEMLNTVRYWLAKPRTRDVRGYVAVGFVRGDGFYAWMLESGTGPGGWRKTPLLPRPFLVPAAQRHIGNFTSRVIAAIDESVRKANEGG